MALALTQREKKLLGACLGALLLMATFIMLKQFLDRRTAVLARITSLENEKKENGHWMDDREFWDKRSAWMEQNMPTTESLGTAQAKLLEEIQNVALDYQLQVQKQQLLPDAADSKSNASVYREVAVEVRLRGDQTTMLGWLASLQSPEKFQAIKQLELEIDTKAKEKTPQTLCNLVLARWFKPETGFQP
ncbi:GspMb/PilO family protein [Prosthecobacter sp.]|uniref:GspMb/PilO family protein n=1 Tax=Prosthecobacter sp. TaxID=1965333 RepID=UPI0024881CC2|nr:GspMb/PilO family protein [Prosthecobacter sp.]MDI1312712.1 GspMb/PilO family protein [Prosthecobacter sp.]